METGTPRVKQTGVVEQSKQMADGDLDSAHLTIDKVEIRRSIEWEKGLIGSELTDRFVFWIQVVTLKFKAQFKFVGKERYWRKSHEAF